jgi:hypothetical protein
MSNPPKIDNAPGLTWKLLKGGWEARWRARTDLIERGYAFKSLRLWRGWEPTPADVYYITDHCNELQTEMLVWGRGGIPIMGKFDDTVASLIDCYQTDLDSPYHKLRYRTRLYYNSLCGRIRKDVGEKKIEELKARQVLHWHEEFIAADHIAMGHSVIGMLRILCGFGATLLEDNQCARLSTVLSNMRFKMSKPRNSVLTAEQAIAVRAKAHELGKHSIALAQAFQFECMFRQKDVIGEWVPSSEPGITDILDGNNKWLRGIRWEEIDENFILTHVTSKRQKEITVDLKIAGMVMEELGNVARDRLPARGPIIVADGKGIPWYHVEFRRNWRIAADAAGVPKTVRNMDSRAGAITEATEAGADIEHIKQAATHSDISMTQRYARGAEEKTAGVMRQRAEHRANKRNANEG